MEFRKRVQAFRSRQKLNGGSTNQDEHIVTVEMHGMRCWCEIVDNKSVTGIGTSIVDVPSSFYWIQCVGLLGPKESWVIVIAPI